MGNEKAPPTMRQDDEYVCIPEELIKHLPSEYRVDVDAKKQHVKDVLKIADKDIKNLIRLTNAIPTTSSLRYIHHRLETAKFDVTTEAVMEQEMLTTAFIVTYSRLFASGSGGSGVSRKQIPAHLRAIHDDIIELRNKRYAHNGEHETIGSDVQIDFDGTDFNVSLEIDFCFHVGGKDEWGELVAFLDAHMHQRLAKILSRLKTKTGYEWTTPVGPAPDWVRK